MAKRLELWHPDSPGGRVTVLRRWPRYLWTSGPDEDGRPTAFATINEVLRRYKELERIETAEQAYLRGLEDGRKEAPMTCGISYAKHHPEDFMYDPGQ